MKCFEFFIGIVFVQKYAFMKCFQLRIVIIWKTKSNLYQLLYRKKISDKIIIVAMYDWESDVVWIVVIMVMIACKFFVYNGKVCDHESYVICRKENVK